MQSIALVNRYRFMVGVAYIKRQGVITWLN